MKTLYSGILAVVGYALAASFVSAEGLHVGEKIRGDETVLLADLYGTGVVTTVTNGYLFIDREYAPRPYRIQRVGQAVLVNGILLNALFRGNPREIAAEKKDWRSPLRGFKVDTPRKRADAEILMLVRHLSRGGACLVSLSDYARMMRERGRKPSVAMTIPMVDRWEKSTTDSVLRIILGDQEDTLKHKELRQLDLRGLGTDEEIASFCSMEGMPPVPLE